LGGGGLGQKKNHQEQFLVLSGQALVNLVVKTLKKFNHKAHKEHKGFVLRLIQAPIRVKKSFPSWPLCPWW
jgi:hypothetical protein